MHSGIVSRVRRRGVRRKIAQAIGPFHAREVREETLGLRIPGKRRFGQSLSSAEKAVRPGRIQQQPGTGFKRLPAPIPGQPAFGLTVFPKGASRVARSK